MSSCDYSGVFTLGMLVALFIFYVAHIVDISMQNRREKDIK